MLNRMTKLALAGSLLLLAAGSAADEREELLKLRAMTTNLIDALVEEGVISREKADRLIKRAQQAAAKEAAATRAPAVAENAKGKPPAVAEQAEAKTEESTVVRVPYVPEFVKEEIREQVRAEVKQDVVKDVVQQAKNEKWGTPEALPDWLSRISFNGDIRLRYQSDYFASENVQGSYINWQQVNQSGGLAKAGQNAFLNVTDNQDFWRERLRLGMDAQITDALKAGVQLTTGNNINPVSTNQALGNYNNNYEVVLNEAYLRYDWTRYDWKTDAYPWLMVEGGRFPNPFFHTDLVWDDDVDFEGAATTYRTRLARETNAYIPALFATAGAFVVQANQNDCNTKWLYAGQVGGDWTFASTLAEDPSKFKLGVAYYDYQNIVGKPNPLGSQKNDCTAPGFLQKGNSLMRISNDIGELPSEPRLVGLAADFNILDLTASYDIARFAPTHVVLTADYARNLGFDKNEIERRTGETISPDIDAYQVMATLGRLKLTRHGDWQVFAGYKRLERDSVLDAFTDSDFHLGGTDAKGWLIGGSYGLLQNTWMTFRWMSADAIDDPPLGVDILQLDLNAKF